MKANIGNLSLEHNAVVDLTHPPIIRTMPAKADNGVLAEGLLVACDQNGDIIAHGKTVAAAMAGTVDGTNKAFTATLSPRPVMPGSVVINNNNAAPQVVTDDGYGRLKGDGTGTVDYATGAIAVTLTTAPANGKTVTVDHKTQPVGVLTDDIDTAEDDAAVVVRHGTVAAGKLLVGSDEPDASDLAALEAIGIWAV